MKEDRDKRRIIIQRIKDLPTISAILNKLVEIVESEKSSAKDLANLIEKDQSLLSAILKLVNSAFYGHLRQVNSVHQATVILGFNTVRSMALGASIFKSNPRTGKAKFDRNALWIHSMGVAATAKKLGETLGYKDAEEAFVAGLLHDVGKVIFDAFFHDDFMAAIETAAEKNEHIKEAETEVMGMDHAEAAQILFLKWQLPLPVSNAIGFHHNLEKCPKNYLQLASIVHISDIITRKLKIGSGGDNRVPKLNPLARKELKLTTTMLESIISETDKNRDKIAMFDIV